MLDWQSRQSVSEEKEFEMIWDIFEDNRKQFMDKLKTHWRKFADDHFGVVADRQVLLVCRIQEKATEAASEYEQAFPRRLVLRGALAMGCSLFLPISLSGCDAKKGAKSSDAAVVNPPATSNDSATPATPGKVSQANVHYQAQPKGEQKCGGCLHFEAGSGTCKLVEGQVSPEGWCDLWAKNA